MIRVRAHSSRVVNATRQVCSDYIRDARNLGDYEQKVTRCTVDRRRADGCTYSCRGWYFGLPWLATFDMHHRPDGGFSSVAHGAPDIVTGGFVLVPLDAGRTRVTHWEDYRFPWWIPMLWAARPWVERWLQRSLEVELDIVRESMEYLERHGYEEPVLPPDRSVACRASRYSLAAFAREQLAQPVR